jgi:hypothetical protein
MMDDGAEGAEVTSRGQRPRIVLQNKTGPERAEES